MGIEPVLTEVERDGRGGWLSSFVVLKSRPQEDSEVVSTKSEFLEERRAWFSSASITGQLPDRQLSLMYAASGCWLVMLELWPSRCVTQVQTELCVC